MGDREEISKQFLGAFEFQGIKRRDFLKFCGATAALLGLSESFIPKIAAAIEKASKGRLLYGLILHRIPAAQRLSLRQHILMPLTLFWTS